MQEQN